MIKIQVQIPEHLFKETKRMAQESEMSFAQAVRLGLETLLKMRPVGRQPASQWRVPKGKNMGLPLVAEGRWTELVHEDQL